jgi:Tfp pilus assembly protein FimT
MGADSGRRRPYRASMKRGATLLELTLMLVVLGLLLAIALPRLNGVTDGLAVNGAAQDIVAAHRRARITAILNSRVVELTIAADDLSIRPRGATTDLWHTPGPTARQVALTGAPKKIIFSPVGLSMGASNASFFLRRGTATRTVVVSRLGRVRVTP